MDSKVYVDLFLADLKKKLNKDEIMLSDITENLIKNVMSLGIEIFRADLSDDCVSGILYFNDENIPRIYLNSSDSPERQRFTLAHELGHLYQHAKWSFEGLNGDVSYKDINYARNNITCGTETEANKFAAELLMPRGNFVDAYNKFNGDIKKIADYFNVSNDAATNRIINLGLVVG